MQIVVDLKEYMSLKDATDLADAIRLFRGVETANARVLDSRPTPRTPDALTPLECSECGEEILPLCESCAGDMARR